MMNSKPQARPPAASPPTSRKMTLASVARGIQPEPARILIYGVGGVGKTTFAAEAPAPIFLDTQDGTSRLDVPRFPRPGSWPEVLEALDALTAEQHPYKTLAVDLLDDLEALIWSYVCQRDGQANIEAYGYGKGYKIALNEWRLFLASLERVRRAGLGVVLVAHAQVRPFKNPEGEDFDRYSLGIHDQASGLIRGWCDTVLFARHEIVARQDARTKRTRGISTGARVVHTVETAAYHAKNRDSLPDTLPLDWHAFAEASAAHAPARLEDVRAELAELLARPEVAEIRPAVEQAIAAAGSDVNKLLRVLNRLRERTNDNAHQEG